MIQRRTQIDVRLMLGLAMLMGNLGCGEALVDGRYRGDPLETFQGTIILLDELDGSADEITEDARVTMTWAGPEAVGAFDSDLEVQMALRQEFPGNYQIEIYEPPPPSTFFDYADFHKHGSGLFSVAEVLVFDDSSGDGIWQTNKEGIIGRTMHGELVLYTPNGVDDRLRGVTLEPGFHIVQGLLGNCTSNLGAKKDIPPIELHDSSSSLPLSIGTSLYFGVDINCDGIGDWHGCVGVILDEEQCLAHAQAQGEVAEEACPEECFFTNFDACVHVPEDEIRCLEEAAALGRDSAEYCPAYCFDYDCYDDDIELEACILEAYEVGEPPEEYCEEYCGSQYLFD